MSSAHEDDYERHPPLFAEVASEESFGSMHRNQETSWPLYHSSTLFYGITLPISLPITPPPPTDAAVAIPAVRHRLHHMESSGGPSFARVMREMGAVHASSNPDPGVSGLDAVPVRALLLIELLKSRRGGSTRSSTHARP